MHLLTTKHLNLFAGVCLIATTICCFGGCSESGPAYVPVEGKVVFKIDQSCAQFGSVEFRSESQPPVIARGKIQKDGTFQLKSDIREGTIEGQHKVTIIQVIGNPRNKNVVHSHGLEVAKKYSSYRTTDLKVNINKETSKQLTLEVDSK